MEEQAPMTETAQQTERAAPGWTDSVRSGPLPVASLSLRSDNIVRRDPSVGLAIGASFGDAQQESTLDRLCRLREQIQINLARVNEVIDLIERDPTFLNNYNQLQSILTESNRR